MLGRWQVKGESIGETPAKLITISEVGSNFEREPLIRPFGFKGGYMREIWQSIAMIRSESGIQKTGTCSQSILWSDAAVFASHSESGGNALMYAMTEYGLGLLKGRSFTDPVSLLDEIWPGVLEYGKKICSRADLTVSPLLVEWNKNMAARLSPFPGIGIGLLETNGHQNYRNWEMMRSYHPCRDAPWAQTKNGVFELDDDYYAESGCIFKPSPHYEEMFQ